MRDLEHDLGRGGRESRRGEGERHGREDEGRGDEGAARTGVQRPKAVANRRPTSVASHSTEAKPNSGICWGCLVVFSATSIGTPAGSAIATTASTITHEISAARAPTLHTRRKVVWRAARFGLL